MTLQTTRWKPDTCDCEIDLVWDDALPPGERTHEATTVRACAAHAALATPKLRGAAAHADNTRKNEVVKLLGEKHPELVGVVSVQYDGDRRLKVDAKGAPEGLRGEIAKTLRDNGDLGELE